MVFLAGVEELGRPRPIDRRVLDVAGNGNGWMEMEIVGWKWEFLNGNENCWV